MLVSLDWLRDYVDAGADAHKIADRLTMTVHEVEEIRSSKPLAAIKVGEVLEIKPHPGADRLWLTRTKVGDKEHRIVCGADNISVGDKVPVALPGVNLPNGLRIERRTIRGERSDGMLCSPRELGAGDDHSGIWLLPPELRSGRSLNAALGSSYDAFELDVLANRPDLMGHLGVAREVAAAFGKPLKEPKLKTPTRPRGGGYRVQITRPGCTRFSLSAISGLANGESPAWLRKRLEAVGVRPISAVVDITNFVMLEYGQPLHAYDAGKLSGRTLSARLAKPAESVRALDGQRYVCDTKTLVIADSSGPIGLAGIMGGSSTEVGGDTTEIVLEAAHFDQPTIRRTARRLGLRTEASARFERGISEAATWPAIRRATDLILEICGGSLTQLADTFPKPLKPAKVRLDAAALSDFLGETVTRAEAAAALKRLGFSVGAGTKPVVTAPEHRVDIAAPVDLYEEVIRLRGFDSGPADLPVARLEVPVVPPVRKLGEHVSELLVGAGLTEIVTHSLAGEDLLNKAGDPDFPSMVRMANPLSADHAYLRDALVPRHLESVEANLRWRSTLKLFEIGRVFNQDAKPPRLPNERVHLLITLATKGTNDRFSEARGVAELLAERLQLPEVEYSAVPAVPHRKGASFAVSAGGQYLGYLAEYAHPARFKAGRIYLIEWSLNHLLSVLPAERGVRPLPRFPAVGRDLSVYAARNAEYGQLREVIRNAGKPLLAEVKNPREFDHHSRRSLAVALEFRSDTRTLTDAEVSQAMKKITAAVTKAGFEVRD